MGKGDLRSRRGKIYRGTHGVTRSRAKEKAKKKKSKPEAGSSGPETPARPA
jgi:ribosomal small subunit protein bTHX